MLYGDETIAPGDVVNFNDLAVLLRGRPITGDIPIDAPALPPLPTVDLSDVTVPSCDASGSITLDASASFGSLSRDWSSVLWSVDNCQGSANCDNLGAQVLAQEGSLALQLELGEAGFSATKGGSFDVSLELTNYLGGVSSKTATVTVTNAGDPAPAITIRGPQVVSRVESFDLEVNVAEAMCSEWITDITYSWAATPQPLWTGISSASGSRLVVPSFGLNRGWYTFTVSTTITTNRSPTPFQVTDTHKVWVGPSTPIALLSTSSQAGAVRPVGLPQAVTLAQSGNTVTLDATASYNPDCLKASAGVAACAQQSTFQWSCCVSEDPFGPNVDYCSAQETCPTQITAALTSATGPTVTVPLPTTLPDSVHLTFIARYTHGGITSNPAFITVTARGLPVISMDVSVTGAIPSNWTEGYIATEDSEIGIFANVLSGATGPVQYDWTIISPSRLNATDKSLFASDLSTGVMLLKPNVLRAGEHLAVEVGVVDSKNVEGTYWVDISVATPPR